MAGHGSVEAGLVLTILRLSHLAGQDKLCSGIRSTLTVRQNRRSLADVLTIPVICSIRWRCLISEAMLALMPLSSQAQVAVVGGIDSPLASLTKEQISSLYLGRTSKGPNGNAVVLFNQSDNQPVRDLFYWKLNGKSATEVRALWTRLVFSGKAQFPKELLNNEEVKKAVVADRNSIGYIDKSSVDASIKVLFLLE